MPKNCNDTASSVAMTGQNASATITPNHCPTNMARTKRKSEDTLEPFLVRKKQCIRKEEDMNSDVAGEIHTTPSNNLNSTYNTPNAKTSTMNAKNATNSQKRKLEEPIEPRKKTCMPKKTPITDIKSANRSSCDTPVSRPIESSTENQQNNLTTEMNQNVSKSTTSQPKVLISTYENGKQQSVGNKRKFDGDETHKGRKRVCTSKVNAAGSSENANNNTTSALNIKKNNANAPPKTLVSTYGKRKADGYYERLNEERKNKKSKKDAKLNKKNEADKAEKSETTPPAPKEKEKKPTKPCLHCKGWHWNHLCPKKFPEAAKAHAAKKGQVMKEIIKPFCTFPKFKDLPKEIREKIWGFVTPVGRVVSQSVQQVYLPGKKGKQLRIAYKYKVPGILHACRESRAEWLMEGDIMKRIHTINHHMYKIVSFSDFDVPDHRVPFCFAVDTLVMTNFGFNMLPRMKKKNVDNTAYLAAMKNIWNVRHLGIEIRQFNYMLQFTPGREDGFQLNTLYKYFGNITDITAFISFRKPVPFAETNGEIDLNEVVIALGNPRFKQDLILQKQYFYRYMPADRRPVVRYREREAFENYSGIMYS